MTFCVCGRTLSYRFVFDDIPNIRDNRPMHVAELTVPALREAAFNRLNRSRPLAYLSFALNYRWSGDDPGHAPAAAAIEALQRRDAR